MDNRDEEQKSETSGDSMQLMIQERIDHNLTNKEFPNFGNMADSADRNVNFPPKGEFGNQVEYDHNYNSNNKSDYKNDNAPYRIAQRQSAFQGGASYYDGRRRGRYYPSYRSQSFRGASNRGGYRSSYGRIHEEGHRDYDEWDHSDSNSWDDTEDDINEKFDQIGNEYCARSKQKGSGGSNRKNGNGHNQNDKKGRSRYPKVTNCGGSGPHYQSHHAHFSQHHPTPQQNRKLDRRQRAQPHPRRDNNDAKIKLNLNLLLLITLVQSFIMVSFLLMHFFVN